jgi:thioredoxin 1
MKSMLTFALLMPVMSLFILAHSNTMPIINTHVKAGFSTYDPPGDEYIIELTDNNFQKKVLASDKLTVVDFWAEWCGPCRMVGPVIANLAKEYKGKINVGKVNVDHNAGLCEKYSIRSIPTVLFIKNGKVLDQLIGVSPKSAYVKKINKYK